MNSLHHHRHQRPLHIIGTFICLMGLLAIAFSITVRAIPGSINAVLGMSLPFSREDLNSLYANYQYYLIACLVLSGLIVDIVGPRTVVVVNVILAIVANHFFVRTDVTSTVLDSRLLIAFTHTFILTGVLTLGTHWLPRRHFSLFVGLLFGTLLMVPVMVSAPIKSIFSREVLQTAIFITNFVGVFAVLGIIGTENIADRTKHRHTLQGLFQPLTYYKVWLIGLVAMLGWMCNTFILDFGMFYLMKYFNFSPQNTISTVQNAFIFFGTGAIFMGIFSDYMEEKRYLIAIGYCMAAICFCALAYWPDLSETSVAMLLYATAFFTSSTIICYTKANDYCTIGNSGITLGLVLSISTIGNSVFAKIMSGLLQNYVADPSASAGNWQLILAIVPTALVLGAVIAVGLLRPIHLRPIVFLKSTL